MKWNKNIIYIEVYFVQPPLSTNKYGVVTIVVFNVLALLRRLLPTLVDPGGATTMYPCPAEPLVQVRKTRPQTPY